jgi:hypothetical protein
VVRREPVVSYLEEGRIFGEWILACNSTRNPSNLPQLVQLKKPRL